MRSDLNKQLCERERHRSSDHYGNYRHQKKFNRLGEEGEGMPSHESMKRRYALTYSKKDLNENLNPLWGTIRKNVGRPWDKFYSDLCKVFDKRSVINQHILDHLFDKVELKVYQDDAGELRVRRHQYAKPRDDLLRDSRTEYYVDPRDGILKINKHFRGYKAILREREAEKRREEAKVFRPLNNGNVLRLVDGVWYEYEMKPYPVGKYVVSKPPDRDVFSVYGKEKDWESMSDFERAKCGIKTYVGERAFDIFTKQNVYVEEWMSRHLVNSESQRNKAPKRKSWYTRERKYHASRKTASKKTLRDVGIKA